jgi:hypothetical protein
MALTSRRSAAGHCLKTSLLPERGLAEQGAAERHPGKAKPAPRLVGTAPALELADYGFGYMGSWKALARKTAVSSRESVTVGPKRLVSYPDVTPWETRYSTCL